MISLEASGMLVPGPKMAHSSVFLHQSARKKRPDFSSGSRNRYLPDKQEIPFSQRTVR